MVPLCLDKSHCGGKRLFYSFQQIAFGQTYPVMPGRHLATGMKRKAGCNSYAEL